MTKIWLTKIIKKWDGKISWSDNEIDYLSELLSSICEINKGTIFHDIEISEQFVEEYKTERVNNILNSHVACTIKQLFKQSIPFYSIKTEKFSVKLPFVLPSEHAQRINLNYATKEELEKLPGIGNKTAARIILYRKAHGGFKRITELKKVEGISDKEIKKFAHRVYLLKTQSIATTSKHIDTLINNPTFINFIAYLKNNDALIFKYSKNPKDIKDLIIQEIEGIKNNLEIRPKLYGYLPGIRASKLNKTFNEYTKLNNYIKKNKDRNTHGILLTDSNYYYFTQELLKSAQKKIRLIMFYFYFKDKKKYPSDKLMDEIVKAKKRGVDIKIILDHQTEYDSKASHIINKDALEYFRENDIPVTFDIEEIPTHTKLLLVDDSHVLIGSHNWTAGSFFVYCDTSVYINSIKIADYYYSHFESLWKKYRK